MWQGILSYQDPKLSQLVARLPCAVTASWVESTTKKYMGTIEWWSKWASDKGLETFPVIAEQFVLYLQHVGEKTKSKATVEEAVNAISWKQRIARMEQVSSDTIVKSLVEGFQRILVKPKQKNPITPDILLKIVHSLSQPHTLTELWLTAFCLLAYSAFLHFKEIEKLRGIDIQFFEDRMEVWITSSKTDLYWQGLSVLIAPITCPVAMLQEYFRVGGISRDSEEQIFRAICTTKKRERLRPSGSLSYTRMREVVLGKLRLLECDTNRYGLHSFWSGGATAAANSKEISDGNSNLVVRSQRQLKMDMFRI